MATTATTTTPTTLLSDASRPNSSHHHLSPSRYLSLPALPTYKTMAHCGRITRNIVSMATGESVVATESSTTEDAVKPAETNNVSTESATEPTETSNATPEKETGAVNAESTTDVSTDLPEILKTVQNAWDKVEDKYAVSSLAVAAFVGLWGTAGAISAIDRLPMVPGLFEVVGIGYTGWFAYRNLIFKPEREALIAKVKNLYGEITGSS